MFLSLNIPILMAGSFYTVYKFTIQLLHLQLHDGPAPCQNSGDRVKQKSLKVHSLWTKRHCNTKINFRGWFKSCGCFTLYLQRFWRCFDWAPHLKIISAALIRGRRSKKIWSQMRRSIEGGAHSGAALKRVNTVMACARLVAKQKKIGDLNP